MQQRILLVSASLTAEAYLKECARQLRDARAEALKDGAPAIEVELILPGMDQRDQSTVTLCIMLKQDVAGAQQAQPYQRPIRSS